MAKTDEVFEPALIGKKIPILTLDNKWHQLFTQREYTSEIKQMEKELNNLLKRQAKVNDDSKEIKKLKKMMMDEIVVLADELEKSPSKKLEKKQEECRRIVTECNEKLEACEEEMVELPRQINQLNNKLMVATMEVCYRRLQRDSGELNEIEEWIANIRRELKKKVIRKQEKEAMIHQLYSYMHDIFGPDVIEMFDMQYNPEERYQKAVAEKEARAKRTAHNNDVPGTGQTKGGDDALKP